MPSFRAWSYAFLLPLTAWALGAGCGGTLAPVGAGADGGDGGGGGGPEASAEDAPGTHDAPSFVDAPATLDAPVGPCQVNGVPCISASQCCSNICSGQVCGPGVGPTCLPDGTACSSSSECCSSACNGVCETVTPPSCPIPPNASACDVCVAGACCSEDLACQQEAACLQAVRCFDQCHNAAGTGVKCAQSCMQTYPSTAAPSLFQCAATSCLSSCQ